jgi:hypothetical protein
MRWFKRKKRVLSEYEGKIMQVKQHGGITRISMVTTDEEIVASSIFVARSKVKRGQWVDKGQLLGWAP